MGLVLHQTPVMESLMGLVGSRSSPIVWIVRKNISYFFFFSFIRNIYTESSFFKKKSKWISVRDE